MNFSIVYNFLVQVLFDFSPKASFNIAIVTKTFHELVEFFFVVGAMNVIERTAIVMRFNAIVVTYKVLNLANVVCDIVEFLSHSSI